MQYVTQDLEFVGSMERHAGNSVADTRAILAAKMKARLDALAGAEALGLVESPRHAR
jgi:hypothetical protein